MKLITSHRPLFATVLSAALGLTCLITGGCHDNGYRTEVTPGEEGQYSLTRVKEDPETVRQHQAQAAIAKDPDLATIDTKWEALSPQDRKTVYDLVQRLSAK